MAASGGRAYAGFCGHSPDIGGYLRALPVGHRDRRRCPRMTASLSGDLSSARAMRNDARGLADYVWTNVVVSGPIPLISTTAGPFAIA